MKFPEVLYYAEAEGLLPTRAGKINAVINEIRNNYYGEVISQSDFEEILSHYDLTLSSLSSRELNYIEASI